MPTLTPENFCSVADGGRVVLDVDPTGHGDTELFERVVPFGTTATATTPAWRRVPDIVAPRRHTKSCRVGSLYQARLFPKGAIVAGGQPTGRDRPLGVVDLPCVVVETRTADLLTRCLRTRPLLTLDVGDTWMGARLFTGEQATRFLLLVGTEAPTTAGPGPHLWPRFGQQLPAASAASAGPARLHQVYAPPRILLPAEDGIDPESTVHYLALAWTADGHWDYVWAVDGVGGAGTPQAVTTRTREIGVRVTRIACLDDSFENDFGIGWRTHVAHGEGGGDDSGGAPGRRDAAAFDVLDDDADFDLALTTGPAVALALDSWTWKDIDDGEVAVPSRLGFEWSGGAEARRAQIYLGSGACRATVDVPLPAGEGVRSTTHHLHVEGRMQDDALGFTADLVVTVGYR